MFLFHFQTLAVINIYFNNYLTYDYSNRWAAEVGDPRWSWDGQLPFFKNTETFYPGTELQGEDLSALHGFNGPIKVSRKLNFESREKH
jgi:choline dehydrogenase-like flavoprotein